MESGSRQLKPTLGFWALLIYGVGDILGAGIYGLVGKIAGAAGYSAWLAFAVALLCAALTAASYAELVARFPHSGGAAYFCQRGFGRDEPALLVGWLVFCSGVVSMATLSRVFAGYFGGLVPAVPDWIVMSGFLAAVCLVNFLGIGLSSVANVVCTSVEAGGLLIVIVAALTFIAGDAPPGPPADVAASSFTWLGVLQGAALAFYACIGFEDLVNVADESRRPERDLPLAILLALGIAGGMYLVVSAVCVAVIPPDELARSDAPLLDVVNRAAPAIPPALFAFIPLFAVANSALLNGIMASRLLYGMSRERLLPKPLSAVHATRRTPHVAIALVLAIAAGLAVSGRVEILAGTAAALLLGVFVLVHLALLLVKWRGPQRESGFRVPAVVPVLGSLTAIGLVAFAPGASLVPALVMLGIGLAIVVVHWAVSGR